MDQPKLTLRLLDHTFAVCRLAPTAPLPPWASTGDWWAITRTPDELSIVCDLAVVPPDVLSERDWRCLQVVGPLDFALTGILAALAEPLAEARISIFALSTYDTDYVLIKQATLAAALATLRSAGHTIEQCERL